jgi:hypothetical protein
MSDTDLPEGLEDEYNEPEPPLFAFDPPPTPEPSPEPIEGYGAYDPTAITRESTSPTTLHDDEGNPLPGFDEKYRDDFIGLAFVGALSKTFSWLGHTFIVRTLNVDELLAVTRLTRAYDDSLGQGLAYRTAIVAMATETVDGERLPLPYGIDKDDFSWSEMRFNYVKNNWFQFTIDQAYNEYLALEEKTAKVVDAMGKASALTGSTTGSNTD